MKNWLCIFALGAVVLFALPEISDNEKFEIWLDNRSLDENCFLAANGHSAAGILTMVAQRNFVGNYFMQHRAYRDNEIIDWFRSEWYICIYDQVEAVSQNETHSNEPDKKFFESANRLTGGHIK